MADINLLQNLNVQRPEDSDNSGGGGYLNYIGLGIFVIVAAITGMLYYGAANAQTQLNTLNQEQITAKNDLTSHSGYSRFVQEQSNMKFLNYLLPNHLDWSNLSSAFAHVTLKTVSYGSLNVVNNGMVEISGNTTSFAELDKFLKVLGDSSTSPFIESVTLKSVSPSSDAVSGVSFTIDLVVNQKLWSQS